MYLKLQSLVNAPHVLRFRVADGELVYEINPHGTAHRRRRTRQVDKNARLDADAVIRLIREDESTLSTR